ncbi:translation initiation factor IF-2 subunit beta [Candidatus Pacearchaeota archaeon CG10_big_fil_rev_8_21_14_0_10_32_14]|nr:MAG: translation initiation factor IF-2 subunit beta [Candidatus Pacearchaeota archaeon CG10_big_fil_rev_8_21_14_0_10_32_14]
MDNYNKLLEKAYNEVKLVQVSNSSERFEIPKIEGRIEGKKTILTNFNNIASYLRRNPDQFLKFLLKELATSGQIEGTWLVLNNKVPSVKINTKIEQFTKEFVLCKECGKPDTELQKDTNTGVTQKHCLACGAKYPVRKI